jgi:hypothetical protein
MGQLATSAGGAGFDGFAQEAGESPQILRTQAAGLMADGEGPRP